MVFIMKNVIGIDIGGSTTKIVGFSDGGELIEPMAVKAADPLTSAYGAFGKFTNQNKIRLDEVDRVMITGVGSSYINKDIFGLPCEIRPEFDCIGKGGLWLSGLDEAIVVSMGTGTAMVYSKRGIAPVYLGGTGVGGGTLVGLSRMLLGTDNTEHIFSLAETGDISNIDLRISDMTIRDILPGMPGNMTAANFGNVDDLASINDKALGLINMVFETIGMCAIFASRAYNLRDIVLTGNLTRAPIAKKTFDTLNKMFGVNFIIPENSFFSTVIGAAL